MWLTQNKFLRLIQAIPSPKAEPFKQWLAKVGYERIEETEDPELSFDRAMETHLAKGYTKAWINQRLKSIEVRKELTDEWEKRGVQKRNGLCHTHRYNHQSLERQIGKAIQAT